jgi:hypothetical protein
MAAWDEALGGNLATASALVVGAFVLRRVAPLIAPGIGPFLVSGLRIFAEAEFEMQDGIIGKLAEQAVEQLLQTIPAPGPASGLDDGAAHAQSHAPSHAAREIVHRFERTARASSDGHGWHDRDKRARYRHHVRKLRQAVARASRDLSPEKQAYLSQASTVISEDW